MSSYQFVVTIASDHGPVEPDDVLFTLIGSVPLNFNAKHVQVQTFVNRDMPEIEDGAACAIGQHVPGMEYLHRTGGPSALENVCGRCGCPIRNVDGVWMLNESSDDEVGS